MTSLFGKVKEFSCVDPRVPAETPGKTGTCSPHRFCRCKGQPAVLQAGLCRQGWLFHIPASACVLLCAPALYQLKAADTICYHLF